MSKAKILEVLAGVHDFYGKEMSDFAAQVWLQAFQGFDSEQVSKALSAHLMDAERGQFMPKPADIVRQLQGTNTDRSVMAWGKCLDAAARVGAYQSVAFDDKAIHAVIEDLGGWPRFCRTEFDDLSYLQKRFCDAYKAYVGRGDFGYPSKLIGDHDLLNASKGITVSPVLIGDASIARQVLENGSKTAKAQITRASDVLQLTGNQS